MKVCVVTWYHSDNYGTCLQAAALYKALEILGYEPYILKYGRDYSLKNIDAIAITTARKIKSKIKKRSLNCNSNNIDKKKKVESLVNDFYRFVSIKGKEDYKKTIDEIDAFVVGSDQLWNPSHVQETFLLDFVPSDLIKMSYATSVGVKQLSFYYRLKYKKRLSKFNSISVREPSAAKLISNITNRNVDVVADPTLLLDESEWNGLVEKFSANYSLPPKYILTYFVGSNINHWNEIKDISEKTGLPVVNIVLGAGQTPFEAMNIEDAGPLDFVSLIQNSRVVCTDSFHAIAFSVNLKKQFWAFKRFKEEDSASQNSRIDDFLDRFGLLNRYWANSDLNSNIDYSSVHEILFNYREESRMYLRQKLDGDKE